MTLDLTITLDTWETYEDEIRAQFDVDDNDPNVVIVLGVELNDGELYQYEEGGITPDELIEERVAWLLLTFKELH